MLTPTMPVYLLIPTESNERYLHPGVVVSCVDGEYLVEFANPVPPLPSNDVNLFFEAQNKFLQQGAILKGVRDPIAPSAVEASNDAVTTQVATATAKQIVAFEPCGNAMSADTRGSYRVSVISMDFFARVEKEARCQLLDVSAEGLSVATKTAYRLGTTLVISVVHEELELSARVRVQTVKTLPDGKFRCGLLIPATDKKMRLTLQRMTAEAQRLQLRRLRRSA